MEQPLNPSSLQLRIRQLAMMFWLRKWTVLAVLVVTVAVAGLRMAIIDPQYQATALIHLDPRKGQEFNVKGLSDQGRTNYYEIQQFYHTETRILQSRMVRSEVLRRYVEAGYDDMVVDQPSLSRLGSITQIAPVETSQLLQIHIMHTSPEKAQVLANLTAESYRDLNLERRREQYRDAKIWLEGQLPVAQAKLQLAIDNRLSYLEEHDLPDVDEDVSSLTAALRSANEAYGEQLTRRVQQQSRVDSLSELAKADAYGQLASLLESERLSHLRSQVERSQADYDQVASRYGERHPDRQLAAEKLQRAQIGLEQEVDTLLETERAVLRNNMDEERRLRDHVDDLKASLLLREGRESGYRERQYDVERAEKFLDSLRKRYDELLLASQTQLNNVSIIDEAIVPTSPVKPNVKLSLLIAVFLGLGGGLALAFVREYLDDSITSELEVIAHLNLPMLGVIPSLPKEAGDMHTIEHPNSEVAEAARSLRAILDLQPGRSIHRLLITSSVAREGKTGTTVRLAIAAAQAGKRVVVIDSDLRRPRVHQVFGVVKDIGLTGYLKGAHTVEEIITPTGIERLSIITSGPSEKNPDSLLGSATMRGLLDELDDLFDLVLLDTPPSSVLADAVVLSPLVDGVVLVIKSRAVGRQVVRQTASLFQRVGANLLGVVLNDVDIRRGSYGYQRYYYHYYRSAYANPPEDEEQGEVTSPGE